MEKKDKKNKGCLIAAIVAISVMLIFIFMISGTIGKMSSRKSVKVRRGSYVVIDLQEELPYVQESVFKKSDMTFRSAINALDNISRDTDIEGIILKDTRLPLTQAEEVNKLLKKTKKRKEDPGLSLRCG